MRPSLATFVFAALATLAAACASPCNKGGTCAVEGQGNDLTVCDGSDWQSCGDADRGKIIYCGKGAMAAECTTNGWTFVDVPASQ